MARPLRIEYPGALYHLTSRGDRQEAIFDDDQDRTAFLNVLNEVVSRFRWRCHAYCLLIRGTKFSVRSIVSYVLHQGISPEELVKEFSHLTLAQVYDALSYYYDHKESIAQESTIIP